MAKAVTPERGAAEHRKVPFGVMAMLGLLLTIGAVNYLDRVLPAILAEAIKRDLALSDTGLGFVNGAGFLLVYAAASIPLAQLSDKGRYSLVISLALGLWSAMTCLGAIAANGWQLALSRMGVAVGEAGGFPASHAYIIRNFPQHRQAAAIAAFNLSLPLGSMAGFIVGGIVGQAIGWRATMLVMGGIGLVLAVIATLVLPRRNADPAPLPRTAPSPHLSMFAFVPLLRKKSLLLILIGSGFLSTGGYTATAFTPSFLMRSHGLTLAEAGLRFGLASGVASAIALIVLGSFVDRLAARDPRWLPGSVAALALLALPISVLALHLEDANATVLALAVNYVVPIAFSAPAAVALHRLAPRDLRARMSAMLLLASGIAGGFGPLIAGALSDALTPRFGRAALGWSLHVVPVFFLIGGLAYLAAVPFFRDELEPQERSDT